MNVKNGFGRGAGVVAAAGLIVAGFVATMLSASGAPVGPVAILGLIFGGTVVAASGYLLIFWTLEDTASPIALTILLGSVATSLFLAGVCLMIGQSASTAFVVWTVLVAAHSVRAFYESSPVRTADAAGGSGQLDARDLASTVAIVVVVAVWCRRAAGLLPTLQATGVVPAWSDYFIHATNRAIRRSTGGRTIFVPSRWSTHHLLSLRFVHAACGNRTPGRSACLRPGDQRLAALWGVSRGARSLCVRENHRE